MTETQEQQAKSIDLATLTDIRHEIMREVCELSPADPEADETICVTYEQLASVIQGHMDGLSAALRSQVQTERTPRYTTSAESEPLCCNCGNLAEQHSCMDSVLRSAPALTQGEQDLGGHVPHGGRNDLGPVARPELPHDGRESDEATKQF